MFLFPRFDSCVAKVLGFELAAGFIELEIRFEDILFFIINGVHERQQTKCDSNNHRNAKKCVAVRRA